MERVPMALDTSGEYTIVETDSQPSPVPSAFIIAEGDPLSVG